MIRSSREWPARLTAELAQNRIDHIVVAQRRPVSRDCLMRDLRHEDRRGTVSPKEVAMLLLFLDARLCFVLELADPQSD